MQCIVSVIKSVFAFSMLSDCHVEDIYGLVQLVNTDYKLAYNSYNCYIYRIVASTNRCYYSENQVFGGATNQDMSLNETCYYS